MRKLLTCRLMRVGLLSTFVLSACRRESTPDGSTDESRSEAPTVSVEPIVGFWQLKNYGDSGPLIFLKDGRYINVHRFNDGVWDIGEGTWTKLEDYKLYRYMVDDTMFGGSARSPVTVWRKSPPNEPEVRTVNGAVYEFIAEGESPGSNQNSQFAYFEESDSIQIDHGDYSSWMGRFKPQDKK